MLRDGFYFEPYPIKECLMGFLKIDEEKCKKDGICADECPVVVIDIQKKASFPRMVDGGEKRYASSAVTV